MKNRKKFPMMSPYIEQLLDGLVEDPEEFVLLVRQNNLSVIATLDMAIEADRDPLAVARELGGAQ